MAGAKLAAVAAYAVVLSLSLSTCERARAHDAPSGWSYTFACCSGVDCREVPASAIRELPDGYRIEATGEEIRQSDSRLKPSPDGAFHWCSVGGAADSGTICLFAPPRSY